MKIYKKHWANKKNVVWESKTGEKGGVRLNLQDDGNLCLKNKDDHVVWSSDKYADPSTLEKGQLVLKVSDAGSLVVLYKG